MKFKLSKKPLDPKQRRSLQTFTDVLRSSAKLFAKNGYEATSMDEISDNSGVSIGSIYHLFKNKAGVASALTNNYKTEFTTFYEELTKKLLEVESLDVLVHTLVDNQMIKISEFKEAIEIYKDISSKELQSESLGLDEIGIKAFENFILKKFEQVSKVRAFCIASTLYYSMDVLLYYMLKNPKKEKIDMISNEVKTMLYNYLLEVENNPEL
jgi:AcrR family transcriptional regulator